MATSAQLTVASFAKKERRTSEANFEKKFAEGVRAAGRTSWHPQYKEPGWPDRYISGGAWCELKVLDELGAAHGLRVEQIPKLRELAAAGDPTFYFAKFQKSVIALPFPEFDTLGLSPLKAAQAGHRYSYKDLKEIIKCLIVSKCPDPPQSL